MIKINTKMTAFIKTVFTLLTLLLKITNKEKTQYFLIPQTPNSDGF